MEQSNKIERSELYNEILDIVKQIPREKITDDAPDTPSVAYKLEQLFLKKLSLSNVSNRYCSLDKSWSDCSFHKDLKFGCAECNHFE